MMTNSLVLLFVNSLIIISIYFVIRFNKIKFMAITLLALFIIAVPWVVKTIFASWNQLQQRLASLYGLKLNSFEFASMNTFVLLLSLAAIHLFILSKQSKKSIKWMTLLMTVAFFILHSDQWLLLLIVYFATLLLCVSSKQFIRRYGVQTIGLFVITTIGLTVILTNQEALQKIPQYFQHEVEKKYAHDQENTWMRNGDMSKVGERKTTKETALEVVMEKPQAMYFKGFIGKEFKDDQWLTQSYEEAAVQNELFYWLEKENFYSNTMLANLQFKVGQSDQSNIVVSNNEADQRYRYIPYGIVSEIDSKYIQQDGFEKYPTENESKFSIENNILANYAENASKTDSEKMKEYFMLEANYRQYVAKEYVAVEQADQLILQQDFKKQAKIDYEKSIQFVQDLVAKNIRYNEKTIGKKQVTSTVWQTERKGYAPHYATIGTLAFRMMGIPARYVEGYYITNDQIDGKKPFSKIKVPLSSAHAWTEIYIDQVGWAPIELVPEIRKEMPEVKASYIPKGNHVSKNPTANGATSNDGSKESAKKEIQDHENQTPPQPKREKIEKHWYILVGILLLVILILSFIVMITIRRRKIRKLYKQIQSHAIVEHLQATIHLSEIWLAVVLLDYEENASLSKKLLVIRHALSDEAIQQFENTYKDYQAAKYGGIEVPRSALVKIMEKELIKPLKWWQKLKLKYILMKY